MPQGLYPEGHWKDIPEDFRFGRPPDGVPWALHFLAQFTSRIGYTAGATLADPVGLARWLHIPDKQFPAIVVSLEGRGLLWSGPDGSLVLTERGEQWYGFEIAFRQQMLWHFDEPVWRKKIGSIRDADDYAEIAAKLNEHQAPMLRRYAELLAAEAIQDRSVKILRLGILAAALTVSVANDGTRPKWVPSIEEIGATLVLLSQTADEIGLDPKEEFAAIARMLPCDAVAMISDFILHA